MGYRAFASALGSRVELRVGDVSDPTIVPSAALIVDIEGNDVPGHVTLDDIAISVTRLGPDRAVFPFDAFRSVGFHQLTVGESRFVFGTDDAKLRLSGLLAMLSELGSGALGWNRQIVFSDGRAVRHPKVDFAWLVGRFRPALAVIDEVLSRPISRSQPLATIAQPTRRAIPAETRRLLHRNRRLLEVSPFGGIDFGGRHYSPTRVMVSARQEALDTTANRRVRQLLELGADLTHRTLSSGGLPADSVRRLEELRTRILRLRDHPVLCGVAGEATLPTEPSPEEHVDYRYRVIFELWSEAILSMAWSPALKAAPRFAFVAYIDEVYQAFVASTIARALELHPVHADLRPDRPGPSFSSDAFDLYYDTLPPIPWFSNWRTGTERPAAKKPDIAIVHHPTKSRLLIDAKYRLRGNRATPEAIDECQVYMQTFEVKNIAVAFPGEAQPVRLVSDGRYSIAELSISPGNCSSQYLRDRIAPAIEALLERRSEH